MLKKVIIVPHPRVIESYRRHRLTLAAAIAELVDNSFDAAPRVYGGGAFEGEWYAQNPEVVYNTREEAIGLLRGRHRGAAGRKKAECGLSIELTYPDN
jgi:hypothetical protein